MSQQWRGHLVPRIEAVMAILGRSSPPQVYPADGDRAEAEAPQGWVRGGTEVDGTAAGDVSVANWFVGERYLAASYGQPQRIVWVPPQRGRERFLYAPTAGVVAHYSRVVGGDGLEDSRGGAGGSGSLNLGPDSVALEVASDVEGCRKFAYRMIGARLCPVEADLWCNDYDDLDLLVMWLASAVTVVNAGAVEQVQERPVYGGGQVECETGQRGLRYRLECNFVFPVIAPIAGDRGVVPGSAHASRPRSASVQPAPVAATARQSALLEIARQRQRDLATGAHVPPDLGASPWVRTSPSDPLPASAPVASPSQATDAAVDAIDDAENP